MFLVDWLLDVPRYRGPNSRIAKILFLGLDNSGKTTLLHMLKDYRIAAHVPTLHPHTEEITFKGFRFRTYDIGGDGPRRFIRDYFASTDAVIFLVDAADRSRFQEAREELSHFLGHPALASVPFLVLGNKVDIPTAASEEELRRALGLPAHATCGKDAEPGSSRARPVELFMVSVVKRSYTEALQWLFQLLKATGTRSWPVGHGLALGCAIGLACVFYHCRGSLAGSASVVDEL
mmetsp:Transcript_78324/g.247548  ORF Transcript_78324/g.247548 Transcript_78324/m.247548 type:complete len:234 (+) Transcript_78324:85-786(+)